MQTPVGQSAAQRMQGCERVADDRLRMAQRGIENAARVGNRAQMHHRGDAQPTRSQQVGGAPARVVGDVEQVDALAQQQTAER